MCLDQKLNQNQLNDECILFVTQCTYRSLRNWIVLLFNTISHLISLWKVVLQKNGYSLQAKNIHVCLLIQTSASVSVCLVKMMVHVWMKSMDMNVNACLDGLEPIAKQVNTTVTCDITDIFNTVRNEHSYFVGE